MSYASLKPWIQQFVDHYVANAHAPNPTAAYRLVKPQNTRPDVGASKLMKRADVQAAIHERLVRRREASELDEKWVLDRLRTIADRCMQQEAVTDRSGAPTGEYRFDSAGANRAVELIGKHFAMFTDKVAGEINHIHSMSDDDLDARIAELAAEAGIAGAPAGAATTH